MRVLQVYRTYFPDPPGGLQEAIRQFALNTQKFGIETRIFALSPTPKPQELSFPEGVVIRSKSYGAPASCDIGGLSAFSRFQKEAENADVVHFHFPWPFGDLLRLALPKEKPTLLTYHSDIVRQRWLAKLYAPLISHTLRSVDAVVATSSQYVATSPVLKTIDPQKLHTIPLCISDVASQPVDEKIHSRLGIEQGNYILSISALRYYKGLHTLVRAAPRLPLPVVIAGYGPQESCLRQLASEVGAKNVIFAGPVTETEKTALLAGCRAFAFPSHLRSEAFGLALVEAMMFGRPVVSCAIGTGTSYVNENGVTGIEIAPEDSSALAEALNGFCKDEALARRMGEAGRARYERLFSGENTGRAYADLYRKIAQ
ncbi:MAG: glycosyltransferase [Alphaproteobacteria bacterium]|nr:glycosyltransferase [Alphaproteobacteria bacterium]